MEEFQKYLRQFPGYRPALFEQLLPYLSEQSLDAGEHWLPIGKTCRQVAFVSSGLLRLYHLSDGRELTHCFCRENSLATSYRSLIKGEPSDIAIQALEDTHLIALAFSDLQQLYQQDIFWQQLGRIAAEQEYLETECHHRLLSDHSATDRYRHILDTQPDLLQRVPLQYLAGYLQIAPETLSRIRKKIIRT